MKSRSASRRCSFSSGRAGLWSVALLIPMWGLGCASPPVLVHDATHRGKNLPDAIDLTPVAEPRNLGMVLRLRSPGQFISTGFAWLDLAIAPEQLVPSFGKKPMPFDLNASLDLAVLVDDGASPTTHYGASLPLRSLDEMKEALADYVDWRPLANGAYAMDLRANAANIQSAFQGSECAIAPSWGDAKARFVCAEKPALPTLLPYLTRTLTRSAFEHDGVIELRPNAIKVFLGRAASSASWSSSSVGPSVWSALLDGVAADARRFGDDVRGVTVSLDLDARGARIDAHLKAVKSASTLGGLLMAPADGPPDMFFELPYDTDFSFFGAGAPTSSLTELRGAIAPTLDWARREAGVDKALETSAIDALIALAPAPWVIGASLGAPADQDAAKTKKLWLMAATRTPFSRVSDLVKRVIDAGGSHPKGGLSLRDAKLPPGVSKDAMRLQLSYPIDAPPIADAHLPKTLTATFEVWLIGKDRTTWLLVTPEVEVASSMIHALDATPPAFASRPDASWFKARGLVSGADLGLNTTLDPEALQLILGEMASRAKLPPPMPLLFSTHVEEERDGLRDLNVRVDMPASVSVGLFFAAVKDAISAHAMP